MHGQPHRGWGCPGQGGRLVLGIVAVIRLIAHCRQWRFVGSPDARISSAWSSSVVAVTSRGGGLRGSGSRWALPSGAVQATSPLLASVWTVQPCSLTSAWQWWHSAMPLSTAVTPLLRHHRTWWTAVQAMGRVQLGPRHRRSRALMARRWGWGHDRLVRPMSIGMAVPASTMRDTAASHSRRRTAWGDRWPPQSRPPGAKSAQAGSSGSMAASGASRSAAVVSGGSGCVNALHAVATRGPTSSGSLACDRRERSGRWRRRIRPGRRPGTRPRQFGAGRRGWRPAVPAGWPRGRPARWPT